MLEVKFVFDRSTIMALLELKFVLDTLVRIESVMKADAVVTPTEKCPVPITSKVKFGAVVLIPTLPLVVKSEPSVFALPIAEKEVPAKTIPADTLVLTKF